VDFSFSKADDSRCTVVFANPGRRSNGRLSRGTASESLGSLQRGGHGSTTFHTALEAASGAVLSPSGAGTVRG